MYFAGPYTVIVQGLPRAVCTVMHAEIMIEQAGFDGSVTSCMINDCATHGEVNVSLKTWHDASRCIAHFNGCCWSGARLAAFLALSVSHVSSETVSQAVPSFAPPMSDTWNPSRQVVPGQTGPSVVPLPMSDTWNQSSRDRTWSDSQYGSDSGACANVDCEIDLVDCDGTTKESDTARGGPSEECSCANDADEERSAEEAASEVHACTNVDGAASGIVEVEGAIPDTSPALESESCLNATSGDNPHSAMSLVTASAVSGCQTTTGACSSLVDSTTDERMSIRVSGDAIELKIGSLAVRDGILCSDRVLSEALLSMYLLATTSNVDVVASLGVTAQSDASVERIAPTSCKQDVGSTTAPREDASMYSKKKNSPKKKNSKKKYSS
jgi:hypothetical protein